MPVRSVFESMKVLSHYGIPTIEAKIVHSENELEGVFSAFAFPLAMKIVSSTITHKTDVGGVRLFLKSKDETVAVFREMAAIRGFEAALIQPQVSGIELIIGGTVDPQFGPSILFGLGGVFVEIFKDVSMRICPIDETDARKMIHEIRGYPLLRGARGMAAVNEDAIVDILLKTSQLMLEENIRELDINPLIATSERCVAVDARIIDFDHASLPLATREANLEKAHLG